MTADAYVDYIFEWKNPVADKVIVTGSFDNWVTLNQLLPEVRDGAVVYEWKKRLRVRDYQYKFVVDGVWQVDRSKPVALDDAGNENNVLYGSFILGSVVAREIHNKTFAYTKENPDNKQSTFLKFQRYPGQCESGHPWHGEWELSEGSPENVVQRGKFSVSLHRTKRVLLFEPALSCGNISTATYDISALHINAVVGDKTFSFTRYIS